MVQLTAFGLLCLATSTYGQSYPAWYANMTFEAPRTLSNAPDLNVQTSTGTYVGTYNDTYPNVRQFLRVPFAQVSTTVVPKREDSLKTKSTDLVLPSHQPPVGELRWAPPHKPKKSCKKIDSTRMGPGTSTQSDRLTHIC